MRNTYQGRLTKKRQNYGFIQFTNADGKPRDVFVHFNDYLHGFTPEVNQVVEFEFGPSALVGKPPVAVRVRVVKSADDFLADFQRQYNAGAEALAKGRGQGGGQ